MLRKKRNKLILGTLPIIVLFFFIFLLISQSQLPQAVYIDRPNLWTLPGTLALTYENQANFVEDIRWDIRFDQGTYRDVIEVQIRDYCGAGNCKKTGLCGGQYDWGCCTGSSCINGVCGAVGYNGGDCLGNPCKRVSCWKDLVNDDVQWISGTIDGKEVIRWEQGESTTKTTSNLAEYVNKECYGEIVAYTKAGGTNTPYYKCNINIDFESNVQGKGIVMAGDYPKVNSGLNLCQYEPYASKSENKEECNWYDKYECLSDGMCVQLEPHSKEVVNKFWLEKQDFEEKSFIDSCEPDTLDCGQGIPTCINNVCGSDFTCLSSEVQKITCDDRETEITVSTCDGNEWKMTGEKCPELSFLTKVKFYILDGFNNILRVLGLLI